MKQLLLVLAVLTLLHCGSAAQVLPGGDSEILTYEVNWPSGLSLGEAQFTTARTTDEGGGHRFELNMSLEAAVPGFSVTDRYRSTVDDGLCSMQFEKETTRGKKVGKERTVFDQQTGTAKRETIGGGNSQLPVPPCAKDALVFLYHLRRELSQGRLPSAQPVFFGGPYQVRLEFVGRQRLTIAGQQFDADRITGSVKGKASETSFELFFAQDKARRPLLLRVPLALGTFSLELVP